METWERPSHRRGGGRSNPSFSSSLLDAIYRSIDESEGGAPDPFLSPSIPISKKKQSAAASSRNPRSITDVEVEKPMPRRKHGSINYYDHFRFFTSTSSSSDAEPPRSMPIRTAASALPQSGRIRLDMPPPPPPPYISESYSHQEEKKKVGSIRGRFGDLRKPRAGSAPSSPGARLASFLNSLFTGTAGSPKKAKASSSPAPRQAGIGSGAEESTCSSASSYTRSCLSKTPPSVGRIKRSVRFGPMSVVAAAEEDEKDPAPARERERRRRMVEELLRGLEEEEENGGGAESDGSSDLFELEDLSAVGGRYRDELPVYETTHLATNRAISRGLFCK